MWIYKQSGLPPKRVTFDFDKCLLVYAKPKQTMKFVFAILLVVGAAVGKCAIIFPQRRFWFRLELKEFRL